jgi:hypothetical protein
MLGSTVVTMATVADEVSVGVSVSVSVSMPSAAGLKQPLATQATDIDSV